MAQVDKATDQVNYLNPNYPGSQNIADSDQNLLMGDLFIQLKLPSLPRQIFSNVEITGATGGLFTIRHKNDTNDFELIRRNFNLMESQPIKTGVTTEVMQDVEAMYGKSARLIICNMLRSMANNVENTECLRFLKQHCLDEGTVQANGQTFEDNFYKLTAKVHECILKANSKNIRTFNGWCVMPYRLVSVITSVMGKVGGIDKSDHRSLYVGECGFVKYYFNPDTSDDTIYVGLHDEDMRGRSSAYFGNFSSDILKVVIQESGQHEYYIYNRFGFALAPEHEEGNPMLFKFKLDES